jgi:hypothetical protein
MPGGATRHAMAARSPHVRPAIAVAALLLAAAPAAAAFGSKPRHQDGDTVRIAGLVTDAQGQPIADLAVVLEAGRRRFDIPTFEVARKHVVRRATTSGANGEFALDWRRATTSGANGEFALDWAWDPYYDDFRLLAELPMRVAGGERREVLASLDLTQRMLGDSPVPASLVVADTRLLVAFRGFLAGLTSEDERRTYESLGRPDSLQTFVDPRYTEESWWYFSAGKVVRFRDGVRSETADFPPVKPF